LLGTATGSQRRLPTDLRQDGWRDIPVTGAPDAQTKPIVVVIGGGTMGSGIVHSLVARGATVFLAERDQSSAGRARERVSSSLARLDPPLDPAVAALHITVGLPSVGEMGRMPDLVFETVPEQLALKQIVSATAEVAYPDVIIATNTSALSIDQIATTLREPGRLVGMHFFNPVPASRLIEIVVGPRTSVTSVAAAQEWSKFLGKEAIEVRDSPGLATSRLGVAIGLEAIRMVEDNVASVADIDRGMTLGYKFPLGPLELTDRIGLDVRLAIAEHLNETLGARFRPPELLRQMVAQGQLGRKNGRGFYRWTADGKKQAP
jgi:3-hydroxybutyryl-CoA dehydrogenase